jgi:hypothetical protein
MKTFRTLGFAVFVAALTACGGGGGGGSTPAPAPTIADAQGIWSGTSGSSAGAMSAIVLPNGTAWALMSSPTRLFKGSLVMPASSITGSGKLYTLGTTTIDATVSLTASLVAKASLGGNITSASPTEAYNLVYQTRYDTAAAMADFAGTWTGTLGAVALTWPISNGVISGTSTTGCTYIGTVSLRSEAKAVVDAVVTETCSGVVKQLSGVAVRSGTTGLVMLLTTSTGTDDALAVILSK